MVAAAGPGQGGSSLCTAQAQVTVIIESRQAVVTWRPGRGGLDPAAAKTLAPGHSESD